MHLKRSNSSDPDFHLLVEALNRYLDHQYGQLQEFYSTFNRIDNIPHVVLAYVEGKPAGCGCFKKFDDQTVEIKRMFVADAFRGRGIGAAILQELEDWARLLGQTALVLEYGNRQPEAALLYRKMGFTPIPNYGQYIGMEETSICLRKTLTTP